MLYPLDMGTGISARYLHGLGKLGEDYFMVLDLDAIICDDRKELATTPLTSQAGGENRHASHHPKLHLKVLT